MDFFDILTLVGALAVVALVLVATYYASRWYVRRMGGAPGSGRYIKFHDRASLGGHAALVIAQIGEKYYLLGVSEKNMQLICELPDFDPESHRREGGQGSFGQIFSNLLRKNDRGQNGDDGSGT